jgi:hypothetical protein
MQMKWRSIESAPRDKIIVALELSFDVFPDDDETMLDAIPEGYHLQRHFVCFAEFCNARQRWFNVEDLELIKEDLLICPNEPNEFDDGSDCNEITMWLCAVPEPLVLPLAVDTAG